MSRQHRMHPVFRALTRALGAMYVLVAIAFAVGGVVMVIDGQWLALAFGFVVYPAFVNGVGLLFGDPDDLYEIIDEDEEADT